jgi:protein kinase-like protein
MSICDGQVSIFASMSRDLRRGDAISVDVRRCAIARRKTPAGHVGRGAGAGRKRTHIVDRRGRCGYAEDRLDDAMATGHDSATPFDETDGGSGRRAPSPAMMGAVLAGCYEIRSLLRRGGMGLVVCAHDPTPGENVAIKLLRRELSGDRRWADRLVREVKLARQIQHPKVCRVFDFVQAEGHVFIVMERGVRTLRDELKAESWRARPVQQRVADAQAVGGGDLRPFDEEMPRMISPGEMALLAWLGGEPIHQCSRDPFWSSTIRGPDHALS